MAAWCDQESCSCYLGAYPGRFKALRVPGWPTLCLPALLCTQPHPWPPGPLAELLPLGPTPSMMEYSLDGHNVSLSAIRTVRVLRPLRAINRVPSK